MRTSHADTSAQRFPGTCQREYVESGQEHSRVRQLGRGVDEQDPHDDCNMESAMNRDPKELDLGLDPDDLAAYVEDRFDWEMAEAETD